MKYKIIHNTTYKYEESINLTHNQLRLKPRNFPGQKLLSYELKISPQPSDNKDFVDFFGNNVNYFSLQYPHDELIVISESIVERNLPEIENAKILKELTIAKAKEFLWIKSPENDEALQYTFDSKYIITNERIKFYAIKSLGKTKNLFTACNNLINRIFTDFSFVPGFTTIATPLEKVFEERKGVCQDFAHFAIACFRSVGLAARYVSGYIETIPPPGKEKLVGSDASHAWISVFFPKFGWIDFDPTNNQIVKNQHITIGWGADYFDIIPVRGVIFGYGHNSLDVAVDMNVI